MKKIVSNTSAKQVAEIIQHLTNGKSLSWCHRRYNLHVVTIKKYIALYADGCQFVLRSDVIDAMTGLTLNECVAMYRKMVNSSAAHQTVRNFLYKHEVNYFKLSV